MTDRCFLDRLSAADRAVLEELFVVRDYAHGESVISHLDEDRDVFFVLAGRVSTNSRNAAADRRPSRAGSSASTVAERGAPSIAASSADHIARADVAIADLAPVA